MRTVEVTRTYLEVKRGTKRGGGGVGAGRFKPTPKRGPTAKGLRVQRVFQCAPAFYRFLYTEIGRANYWTDRLAWGDHEIRAHLARPAVSLWLMSCHGGPAGYFELVEISDDEYEINYLGLLPDFQGRGLGKHLLTYAVKTCWKLGARRVQLDTCNLDHPAALQNYLKHGFRPYSKERFYRVLPVSEAEEQLFRSGRMNSSVEYG
jgi:GNAT superfamily N-acetyltransferase